MDEKPKQKGRTWRVSRPRQRTRSPAWYHPQREDPARLPRELDLRRGLQGIEADGGSADPYASGVVYKALPRRAVEAPEMALTPLLMEPDEKYTPSLPRTFSRFLLWLYGLAWFTTGMLWDRLLRRDDDQRRAQRLVRIINRIGGTLIKFGQQLAMRVDLLPYAYCAELSKLLDRMPGFPFEQAKAAIERATGRALKEVFARFDPEPIGSASIACVYQAVLRTGERVAVKVRRPGVGEVFAADLRAFGWIVGIVEWLSIIRPGSMRNIVRELEISFMEELNLRREAYFQEIFRRNSQDPKLTRHRYFSAPRVFFEYTTSEVIVQDFVSGIWLWEILAGVERRDPAALARMRELNIDPKIVARRLMWVSLWGNLSNVLFHADPHPANVIVQADNHLIFIDFGACGYISTDKRHRFQELFRCQGLKDVSGMVKAVVALLEPLPPIDLHEFERDLERLYFQASAALWSKHARWWERTTATLWLSFMQLSRQYRLPVNSDTVKGLRATLLYDTLALRLDNDLDVIKASQDFMRDSMHVAGKRMRKQIRRRLQKGLLLDDFARLEELSRLGARAIEQFKRATDHPPFNFASSIAKPVYAVITAIRVAGFLALLLGGVVAGASVWLRATGRPVSLDEIVGHALSNPWFEAVAGLGLLVGLRRIMFRLNDRDV